MIALLLPLLLTATNDLAALVDPAIARWDRPDSPGGALAVIEGDELVYLRVFGAARLSPNQPITGSTPMYLASLAKSFTAACAVHAARAGKLDLDAPLTATFPELSKAYAAATLRHCLHHRSGVVDVYDLSILADLGREASRSNDAAIELLTRVPQLSMVPGERFLYSNSGYVLLAEAIRRRTGQGLEEYAQEHLFGPLKMKDTRYNAGDAGARTALSYGSGMAGWAARERATNLTGPGGMVASIDDLVTFARAWHAGSWGGEGMHAELLKLPPGPHHPGLGGYAVGWMKQRMHGQDVERHFGGGFGFSSDFIHVPALDLTVIALSNAADLDAADLASALLSKVVPAAEVSSPEPKALAAGELERLAGIWTTPGAERFLVLVPADGGLRAVGLGDLRVNLIPSGPRRMEGAGAQSPFAIERDGDLLYLEEGDVMTEMRRVPTDSLPSADEVAGEYANEILGAGLVLVPGPGGSLVLEQHDALVELSPFVPLANDLFLCDRGALLRVERDDAGAVTGLVASVNRAWGLRFERVK